MGYGESVRIVKFEKNRFIVLVKVIDENKLAAYDENTTQEEPPG